MNTDYHESIDSDTQVSPVRASVDSPANDPADALPESDVPDALLAGAEERPEAEAEEGGGVTQPTLFDLDALRTPARLTDPDTSHAAAETVPLTEQMAETLTALRRWPGPPPTSQELAGGDVRLRYLYARRLADLRELGYVANGPSRPCRVSGRNALTWRVA